MTTSKSKSPVAKRATKSSPAPPDAGETVLVSRFDRIPLRTKLAVPLVLIVGAVVSVTLWHALYFHWFEVHTGANKESGTYYGFWSGFGSDISEFTIFVGMVAAWRHHNCHVHGCARIGRSVPGTPYVACPKHHPAHKGYKRSISLEDLNSAHKTANPNAQ